INAVMYICQIGTAGRTAVADVLLGKVTPSGKLTDTWAKTYSDLPYHDQFSYLNGNLDEEYYHEDIYVGYRYFDSFNTQPAYELGYGKSYTDFEIETKEVQLNGSNITVIVNTKNIGDTYCGKEVVQVYLSAPQGKLCKEYQSLVGFAKTNMLAPQIEEEVTVTFDIKNFASYDEETAQYILEKGEYIVRVGNSSRNIEVAAVITLDKKVTVSQHTNICPQKDKFEVLSTIALQCKNNYKNAVKLTLKAEDIELISYNYNEMPTISDKRVNDFMTDLSLEDMAEIVVGIGMFGGEKVFDMPGSVGNTTSKFWDKGLANVTLCDGPAGIRIAQRAAAKKDGSTKLIDMPLSAFRIVPNWIQKLILADPQKSTVLYQYTTAFPVATAIAQTFNVDLAYKVGTAIYREMKEYGCTFWLAPALNIHRNPLCGRNFEYYSEDPVLSGIMAAAVTKGVQQEDGYYVTIKHFAANNQEDNRKGVSSNVSERALREIYLRGFEYAVRRGGAKGVMTSYNKINGVYAPNSHDLCTKVLRSEWGFDGVV
ncbi:MAG: fibronectin type III-like domain-contianing protein, partial [Oscillospiraceae bacterium]|nr:fibronectin type III-like domain-contianing protein [Oscillospiraceae bacterium]